MRLYDILVLVSSVAIKCLTIPYFEHPVLQLDNNSYISIDQISDGRNALKCMTDNVDCCNDTSVGNWRDVRGSPVQEGRAGSSCLYVTRGDGEISLNRNSDCIPHISGLWRCDISDSSGDNQSLYIYISNSTKGSMNSTENIYTGQLVNLSLHFTLHTDPRAEVPEFTISCRTYGGPATTVIWTLNDSLISVDGNTSQVILDTSYKSVFDNRLLVKGRKTGSYNCKVSNNVASPLNKTQSITGIVMQHL